MSSFEDAKQYLMKSSGDKSVYDHLSEVLLKLLIERPDNAAAILENVSAVVKRDAMATSVEGATTDEETAKVAGEWTASCSKLFVGVQDQENETEIADVVGEAVAFKWAGIDLGSEEVYRLSLSLQDLGSKTEGLSKLSLWGKILGTSSDYYIAEGLRSSPSEGEENVIEADQPLYFVCSKAGQPWVALDDVTPEQIVAASKLKKFFSGNLDAPVTGYPPFPGGTEKGLLRATIARITADCAVAPASLYTEPEEGGIRAIPQEEEVESVSVDALQDGSAWVKIYPDYNALGWFGRCAVPDDEDEAPARADADLEWVETPLQPLDSLMNGDSWSFRSCPSIGGPHSYAVIKSQKWPGAVAVAKGVMSSTIYVGYGVQYSPDAYSPPAPAALQVEKAADAFVEDEDITVDPNPVLADDEDVEE